MIVLWCVEDCLARLKMLTMNAVAPIFGDGVRLLDVSVHWVGLVCVLLRVGKRNARDRLGICCELSDSQVPAFGLLRRACLLLVLC
jgi:hypothetical protein